MLKVFSMERSYVRRGGDDLEVEFSDRTLGRVNKALNASAVSGQAKTKTRGECRGRSKKRIS